MTLRKFSFAHWFSITWLKFELSRYLNKNKARLRVGRILDKYLWRPKLCQISADLVCQMIWINIVI